MTPKQVMVIDDDADIRQSVREVLEDAGYRVEVASNGRDALDRLIRGDFQPRVILLDLMMPVMDGHTFMEELGRLPRSESIAVIIFSAHTHPKQAFSELKVAGYLRKPVRRSDLIKAVSALAR